MKALKLILDLLPIIMPFVMAFGIVMLAKVLLGVTFTGVFLTVASFMMKGGPRGKTSANIEIGSVKVSWEGAATVALLVAGLLLLIFGFWYTS